MARRSSSPVLALVLAAAILYVSAPSFVGTPAAAPRTTYRSVSVAGPAIESRVSMAAAPGGGAGGAPTRINLAFLGFVAGMAVLGLLGAFFYGSYVGLGSSL
mmetsp:Transcript_56126/g.131410  ORF Transcript_56126/g.131410 Transcript_56126/m.131410 type:complete len:102 (+) Transcript_56126:69-374(+)